MEFIENSVTLQDVAKATKGTVTQVEADCHALSLFVGSNWAGKPALSVIDAHALASGNARRDHEHAAQHRHWRAAVEAWETERERLRAGAFQAAYDAALREGRGAPVAAVAGHEAARPAVGDFERKTPPPAFDGAETAPRLFTQMTNRIKEKVR